MAQHIEIRNEKAPAILKKIARGIEREVAKGLSKTSMKWEFVGMDLNTGAMVWQTNRYIGKGLVFGDTRGTFAVYTEGKVARHIYLVA
jgi:hypothetical protein